MKYLPQRNKKARHKLSIFVSGVIVLFILLSFFTPTLIPNRLIILAKPFWSLRESTLENLEDAIDLLRSKTDLVEENKEREKEIKELKLNALQLSILENENKELKLLLKREDEGNKTLGRILSKGRGSPHNSLIIDVGEGKVFKGNRVFVGQNILIGFIDEVLGKNSRVKLLSAPGNTYNTEVGPLGIPGKAVGLGGGSFEITLPRGVDIKVGDEIVFPSFETKLLGLVEWIDTKPQSSLQRILFKSPVNINQIRWVLVEHNE